MDRKTIIQNACKDAQDIIRRDFPGLDMAFIPYTPGEENQALGLMIKRLEDHPALPLISDSFNRRPKPFDTFASMTLGPFRAPGLSFPWQNNSKPTGCAILIPISQFETTGLDLVRILSAAYPALCRYVNNDGLSAWIPAAQNDIETATNHMISDWYGALAATLIKRRHYLKRLAKFRCAHLFDKRLHNRPELFPTPIAFDAATLILEDTPTQNLPDTPLRVAMHMALEIKDIITPHYVRKWIYFAQRAQMLTWGDFDTLDILGMAVHTSEDLDVRAISSIVATTLELSPNLSTYFEHYNPFTEDEANERHHKAACKALLENLLLRLEHGQPFDFKSIFKTQNIRLIAEHPMGWCAPALEEALSTLQMNATPNAAYTSNSKADILAQVSVNFQNIAARVSWADLQNAFNLIHEHKRKGYRFTGESTITLLEPLNLQSFDFFKQVFLPYKDTVLYDAVAIQEKEKHETYGELSLDNLEAYQ